LYKLIKALEYESIGADDDDVDVLPHTDSRKPSSVIPLRSVHSGGLEPISRVSASSSNPPTKTQPPPIIVTKNESKKEQSALPECSAD
jgi:hypothetical protein